MRRLLPLISALLVVLTFWASTSARASEASVPQVAATAHFDGDHDQVPADEHGPAPHHHNMCAADQIGMPASTSPATAEIETLSAARPTRAPPLSSAELGASLRPPIA